MSVNTNVNCQITLTTSITKKKEKERTMEKIIRCKVCWRPWQHDIHSRGFSTSNFNLRSPSDKVSKIMPITQYINGPISYFYLMPIAQILSAQCTNFITNMCMFSNDHRCFLQYLPCVKM